MIITIPESLAAEDETIMKEIGEKVLKTHALENVFPSSAPEQSTKVAVINTQKIYFDAANIECDDNNSDNRHADGPREKVVESGNRKKEIVDDKKTVSIVVSFHEML